MGPKTNIIIHKNKFSTPKQQNLINEKGQVQKI
jgi:hypothetical protein